MRITLYQAVYSENCGIIGNLTYVSKNATRWILLVVVKSNIYGISLK